MASGESSAAAYARMDVKTTEVAEQLSLCAPLLQRALDVESLLQDEQVVELAVGERMCASVWQEEGYRLVPSLQVD